jgi:hypothetical protein
MAEVDVQPIPISSEDEWNSVAGWLPESFRHAISPLMIGLLFGAFWEAIVLPNMAYSYPSPVQGAFILALIFSPLMYKYLLPNNNGDLKEYVMGLGILGLAYSLIWFTEGNAIFCGGYLSIMIWVWINTTWWQYELPSFRYGIWHAIGIDIGALGGGILAYIYL